MKIAVFVSGRGSNLQAILESQDLRNKVEVKVVVSDKKECSAFQIAEEFSIPTYSIKNTGFSDFYAVFLNLKTDLIVLAGYLKLIPPLSFEIIWINSVPFPCRI